MKLLAVIISTCFATFQIKMRLCTDANRPDGLIVAARGGTEALKIQLDSGDVIPIGMAYDEIHDDIISGELPGDLDSASMVTFEYTSRDIMCLEMIKLENNQGRQFRIIQDYDPYAWDVANGGQDWTSVTGNKVSYWSNSCVPDSRRLTRTLPFEQSCHDRVSFGIIPINECENGSHQCGPNAVCTDTEKAYQCRCRVGFLGSGIMTVQNTQGCTKDPNVDTTTTTTTTPTTTAFPVVSEIFSLIRHMIPEMEGDFENYGCTGVGNMDSEEKTIGRPIDDVDKALNIRKHCIKCARKELDTSYHPYSYNEQTNHCDDSDGTSGRAFCECDLEFVSTVGGMRIRMITPNKNFDTTQCVPHTGIHRTKGQCCKSSGGLYKWFNPLRSCCTDGIVASIGTC